MSYLKSIDELNQKFPEFAEKGDLLKQQFPKLYNNITKYWGNQNDTVISSVFDAMGRGYDLSQPEFEVAGPSAFATFARQLRESDNPALGSWPSDGIAERLRLTRQLTDIINKRRTNALTDAYPIEADGLYGLFKSLTVSRENNEDESESPYRAYDAATTLAPEILDFIPYMKPHRS